MSSAKASMDLAPAKKANFSFTTFLVMVVIVALIVAAVMWVRKNPRIIPEPGPVIN
jgi:hypothetical protein